MTATLPGSAFRLIEDPLGPDAVSGQAPADLRGLLAAFEANCRAGPPPSYREITLRKAFCPREDRR